MANDKAIKQIKFGQEVFRNHKKKEKPYCEHCGKELNDISESSCKIYRSGPPYYETVYICRECLNIGKEDEADG